ncbi:MAG: DUF2225 domain-containing protein [Clostridiales bacterium]|nr:DUF2225 domain-containing protein [Clostridiales bacterium]
MAGLLDGLEQFGLGSLQNANVFEDKSKKEDSATGEAAPIVIKEEDFLLDKSYTCPICDAEFKSKAVKTGKAKLLGTDMDLRPRHEGIDMLKYDVILCPYCGYAALTRYYKSVTSSQGKKIKEVISKSFIGKPNDDRIIYTYEDALERHKLTLANAIVKQAKSSEKAYICLKMAWLIRGKAELLNENTPNYAQLKKEATEQEDEYLKNALEGFIAARQSEDYPMCGMDEETVDYLIAVTALHFDQFDVASKLVSTLIVSNTASPRMKDKARDLKETIIKKIKEKKGPEK